MKVHIGYEDRVHYYVCEFRANTQVSKEGITTVKPSNQEKSFCICGSYMASES